MAKLFSKRITKEDILNYIAPYFDNNLTSENAVSVMYWTISQNLDLVREYIETKGENESINFYPNGKVNDESEYIKYFNDNGIKVKTIQLKGKINIDWEGITEEELIKDIKAGGIKTMTNGFLKETFESLNKGDIPMYEYMEQTTVNTLFYFTLSKYTGNMVILDTGKDVTLYTPGKVYEKFNERTQKEIDEIVGSKVFYFDMSMDGGTKGIEAGELKDFGFYIHCNYAPIYINTQTKEAYHPVYYTVYNSGLPYTKWSPEEKQDIWEALKEDLENRKEKLKIIGDEEYRKIYLKDKPVRRKNIKPPTKQELVPMDIKGSKASLQFFMNKGIFKNISNLKTKEDILKEYRERNEIKELNKEQERKALTEAGEYINGDYIFRDYGGYAIGFNRMGHIGYLQSMEGKLKERLERPGLYDTEKENDMIERALKNISVYMLGHKITKAILIEGYNQKTFENIVISKNKLLEQLGYSSGDKHIYNDISKTIFSLRILDYVEFEYDKSGSYKSRSWSSFLHKVKETRKAYTIKVDSDFAGGILDIVNSDSKKIDKGFFKGRPYYYYSPKTIQLSKYFSVPAYILLDFIQMESGNKKLNNKEFKVIALSCNKIMGKININIKNPYKRKTILTQVLKELELVKIIGTDPGISELEKIPAKEIGSKIIKIFALKDPKKFNDLLHAIYAEMAQKEANILN